MSSRVAVSSIPKYSLTVLPMSASQAAALRRSAKTFQGAETVDATGHIVAPGFIDTHFHWQATIGYRIDLRDGLTSSMDMELGCAGSYIAVWYKAREGVTQANYGCRASHKFARAMVIDGSVAIIC